MNNTKTYSQIKDYYGKVLEKTSDLKTDACCPTEAMSPEVQATLEDVHPEIRDRFYGCGSPLPPLLKNCAILDLGCGSGQDVYMAAKLAGEGGRVIGLDMTDEQLDIAKKHVNWQMDKFGFNKSNVVFQKGYMEYLDEAGIADDSIDVIISNCVINLSPEKTRVLSEIFRVLKPGGEFYFSDVYADRRISSAIADNPIIFSECLGGALYFEDFRRILFGLGYADFRVTARSPITINNPTIQKIVGDINFESITVRAFKLDGMDDRCENYGQSVVYDGKIPGNADNFALDLSHVFPANQEVLVCGNTADMLKKTRYGNYFKLSSERLDHRGLLNFITEKSKLKRLDIDPCGCAPGCC